MINIGIIGYGYWGPNVVRNFVATKNARIILICDRDSRALKRAQEAYPRVRFCDDYRDITRSESIDAVAIATPVFTHYEIARDALQNGKHVFIEKPFTKTVKEAEQLIALAEKKRLKIMVDHIFLFTDVVKKIKEIVSGDVLGHLHYYDATRVNLGLFQHDVNVIWDLAPHDLSIMDHVVKEKPTAVASHGIDHFKRGLEDIAYITMYFANNMIAHFNLNWLAPAKIRTTFIGGQKKMLVWNDLEADEKIKIYDKGVKIKNREGIYNLLVKYRSGDMWSPKIDQTEALKLAADHFIACISKNKTPITDGNAGLRIVKMIEAANKSLKNNGKMVKL